MTIRNTTSALLAGIAGLMMMMSAPSQAAPVAAQQLAAIKTFSGTGHIVQVAKKKQRRRLKRSRKKRRGFNHFHNSFYYAQPFWDYGDFYEDDYDFYDDDDD